MRNSGGWSVGIIKLKAQSSKLKAQGSKLKAQSSKLEIGDAQGWKLIKGWRSLYEICL